MTHEATGDWAVIKGQFRYEIGEITKATEKQVRTRRHGDREAYHMASTVVFSGSEKAARDLFSVLSGLETRHDQARHQLNEQHRARVAAAISAATGEA